MLLKLIKGALAKAPPGAGAAAAAVSPASPFPDAPERSVVVVAFGPSRSNPFINMAKIMAEAYARLGLYCHVVDMLTAPWPNPELESLFLNRQVRYGIAWGGIGADMELNLDGQARNAWGLTNTPVFKMIGDHPAYFLDVNVSNHPTAVNLYGFVEHRDFFMRHLQTQGYGAIAPISQIDSLEPEHLDFKAKQGAKIVFLKNGNAPEDLRRAWRARLPASIANMLLEMSEELHATLDTTHAGDLETSVVGYFAGLGIDVAGRTKFLAFYIAQLDDYLRRVKSTMITTALLDFPIEVHGECWEHIDFTGRHAKLIPYGDYVKSKQLISEALAVLDMSPNTRHQPHERFVRCASRHTLCLTNRIDYLEHEFAPFGQPMFDFNPDSIRATVGAVLDDPGRHVEIGRLIGVEFKRRYSATQLIDFFEMMSDQVQLQQGPDPQVQRFLVWPPKRL